MAYPRRRAPVRRKRPARRGLRRMRTRLPRSVAAKTHLIKRLAAPVLLQNKVDTGVPILSQDGDGSFFLGTPTGDSLPGTSQVGMSAQFQLSSVIDPSDLTNLFDRYKITGVSLKFQFLNNIGAQSSAALPTIYYAWDGDDAAIPGTAATVLTKGYCKTKVLNANSVFKAYLKPRVTKLLYNGPISGSGYSSEKACWIDCTNSSVPHYGMKFWISNWSSTTAQTALRIQPTYYLALKDTQ